MGAPASITAADVRIDVWLWAARFFKTRALATDYITRKGLRLTRHGQTRKTNKPGARLLPGDCLTFYRDKIIENIEVLGLGERRGPLRVSSSRPRSASG